MKPKMERFLKSIQLDDIENFDIDFTYVLRNQIDRNQVDMGIEKDSPWSYHLLARFLNALSTIEYPYAMEFQYKNEPSAYDVMNLLEEYLNDEYRFKIGHSIDYSDNIITLSVDDESLIANIEKEFQEHLDRIGYNFKINVILNKKELPEAEPEEVYSDKEKKKIEKKVTKIIEKDQILESENETSYYSDNKASEEEKVDELRSFEENYLKIMRANQKKMVEERKAKKAWKKGDYIPVEDLSTIKEDMGNVDINGELFEVEEKPRVSKNNKLLRKAALGSGMSAVRIRFIESGSIISAALINDLKDGVHIRIRGAVTKDNYSGELYVLAHYADLLPPPKLRTDKAEEKRVELHLHTLMSTMDGIGTMDEYCRLAKNMGHKAIAVTDHGVVQAFPKAQTAAETHGIKMIYGSELYMVDADLPFALNPSDIDLNKANYAVFDLETTGTSAEYDRITQFGGVRVEHGRVVKTLNFLINPGIPIPKKVQDITRITDEMVQGAPSIEEKIDEILEFFEDTIVISHNIEFDISFMNAALMRMGRPKITNPLIDTLSLSRYLFPDVKSHRLGSLTKRLGLDVYNEDEAHRADFDARVLSDAWLSMIPILNKNLKNDHLKHSDLSKIETTDVMIKHAHTSHVVVLLKSEKGIPDLYKLISESHITYLSGIPKTPKSIIAANRQYFLIGSACFNGEIFETASTKTKEDLKEKMKFYDYIELQPLENYSYLVDTDRIPGYDRLKKHLLDIVECADELGIPVVATGDCHYVNPEDKILRDIYITAKGVGGVSHPLNSTPRFDEKKSDWQTYERMAPAPNQHYRSTTEMLEQYPYLSDEKTYEIVVKNSNMIADMCEEFKPIKKDLHIPFFKNTPEILTNETYKKAHELYGDELSPDIDQRLQKELHGIIDNGYSVTYYIAREIIKKANEDGYMVGSRGSVGSSLVASLFGITEVNPLKPHYRCPNCRHFEYSTNPKIRSGFDLPQKLCPICGEIMISDGQNIPFETFLGFNADKIPDIDLNFPSDYQAKAHDYTKVLLGENNVFRAGTIETVKDKTAFGYVRGYYARNLRTDPDYVPRLNMSYLAYKITGVKRTTGQHPGGIMVIPQGESVYDFTPIQYPANDKDNTWFTTHFEYKAIHDALLKLDLLGHVDPLALKLMSELTGVKITDIPLNDQKVLSLFSSDVALERSGNYLSHQTGAMGIPEFGTEFVQGILVDSRPKTFSELVIISALSHGTDVWNNNAENLIKAGTCTLEDVIGCRDDIMTYLIGKGIDNSISFSIMEVVRKGRKLNPEFEEIMRAHGVPEWYIDSCNKIKYMFPKAHAVAYVTQAVRVGYFKVYYPLEYYAVWFSSRCDKYDPKALLGGLPSIISRYDQINKKKATKGEVVKPNEQEIQKSLVMAIEMTERGYKFLNIDVNRSDGVNFVVDHEKKALIMPFIVIDGLGVEAANSIIEARKERPFSSREDLLDRTKLNSTNVKDLVELGALNDLPETDQISLFDFSFE